jgi:biopolymer transport protein ExbD
MKVRAARIVSQPKLMIIPMIDIIFFLLVFFMVSALQMVYQKTLPVSLPASAAAQHDMTEPLTVTVFKDGRIGLYDQLVAEDDLAAQVRKILEARPGLGVIIRADQKAEHGYLIRVMDQLKAAGVHKMAIAAEEKRS